MEAQVENINDSKRLGQIIRARRKEMKITQQEVAKFCDLSHTGIGKIENGSSDVKLSTLIKLFKILGLKIQIKIEE
jgi:transcriptional regulator with XRE-family HTH domain